MINNSTRYTWQWWGGGTAYNSGDTVPITAYTINPGQTVNVQFGFFWTIQNISQLTMTYNMSDGSHVSATWYRIPTQDHQNVKLFTMRCTGKITEGIAIYRSVEADIDITKTDRTGSSTDKTYISSFKEINESVSP
jgi:hypothetical protein